MEGLPSNHWLPYLTKHLNSLGSAKCPQRLLTKILKNITKSAHSQWKHRNKYVHEEGRPFEQTGGILPMI
jgi:Fe-S cluster biosynthesis and repair protein YggX